MFSLSSLVRRFFNVATAGSADPTASGWLRAASLSGPTGDHIDRLELLLTGSIFGASATRILFSLHPNCLISDANYH